MDKRMAMDTIVEETYQVYSQEIYILFMTKRLGVI